MDTSVLEQWYERYGYAVHRRCMQLLHSAAEADDALHDIFLRAHRYGHTLAQAAPLPWLYRIADRHCLEVLAQRRRVAPATLEQLAEHEQRSSAQAAPEAGRLVAQVLSACKQRVQQVAVLYYVDGCTQDEVAEELGCSRKTVKEKLAQFKEVARALLAPSEET